MNYTAIIQSWWQITIVHDALSSNKETIFILENRGELLRKSRCPLDLYPHANDKYFMVKIARKNIRFIFPSANIANPEIFLREKSRFIANTSAQSVFIWMVKLSSILNWKYWKAIHTMVKALICFASMKRNVVPREL